MRFISKFLAKRRGSLENFNSVPALTPVVVIVLGIAAGFFSRPATAQTPIKAGYRDFNYGSTPSTTPTAEKPESKLWWNDSYWWGSLWDPVTNKYRIHRFDMATQSWTSVGPDIDDRKNSLGDALWDGQKLYVASHVYAGGSQQNGNTTPAKSARLYRYSYDPAADTYSLDAGFPVLVNSAESETLVLDKDSTGQLWVTWTQANKVYVNRSLGNDLTWGTPFILPMQGADLDADDISTIIAFGGNKIGVMWSNQIDLKVYFAVHLDNKADTQWEPREVALADANLGAVADDHLNVKMMSANGNLYAVAKTSLSSSSAPRIYALKRTPGGVWTKYTVSNGSASHTRPIVILDEENNDLYVFASGDGVIRMKKVSLSNINFPAGDGEAFIHDSGSNSIDNPTAAKHNVNSTTGLLVLACTQGSNYYFHNYINLPASESPTITSFTPASGPIGTLVTITGNNFNGATSVAFNGTAATSFTIGSNTQITATVPAGATSGKISVAKSAGTALSVSNFMVRYTLATNVTGAGSVEPSGGVYNAGAVVTLTATPNSGYEFSGWSGDLNGATNPATITMDSDKNVTANFTVSGGSGGQVVYEETQTGGSSNSTTVATSTSLAGVNGHLYLAAIATRPYMEADGVAGLGLSWTRVRVQCAGRNQTGVEVWMAQGTPSGSGTVTATFASALNNAAIAVSRYSGVDTATPLGNIVSGNTNGVNGACSDGSDDASYSFNLTTAVNGAMVYGAATMRNRTHTPGAGYTQRAEIGQGSVGAAASIAVQERNVAVASTVALDGSFSSDVDWAVIGLEIKPGLSVGAIVHEESQTGGSSGSAAVTTSASLTGVNGHLYLAAISTRPKRLVLSVTGLGLNWTLVKSICSGNDNSTLMEVWMAQGMPSGDGAVTATFASAPNSAVIAVSRYSGVAAADPIGNVIGGNSNGLNGACSGGPDGNAYSFNLATTANDAVVYGAVAIKARTHTPGAGYTERVEFQHPHAVNPIGVAIEDKSVASPSSVTVNGSFSGLVDWAMVALEIRPATPPSGSFIVHEESQTGGSSGSTNVMTSSSLAGVNGHLYLAAISTRPKKLVLSVTGLGLNWTLVKSICSGNNNSTLMEVWMAQGMPSGDGAVTATFEEAPNTAVIAVSRYSGVAAADPIGNVIGGNTNGLNGACSGGVDGNAYSFNLATTANDAVVYGAVALKARTHTPGAGYTERVEFQHPHAVNPIGVAIEDKSVASSSSVTVNGSFNGLVDWAVVALEIRPATPPSGNFIVHEESQTGGSSGSTNVMTSSSLAGVNGHLYLAAISTRPKKLVLSVTGLGLNWTLVKSICSGNNNSTLMEVWMAQDMPSGAGAVTATFEEAPNTAVIAVSRYSGVAAADPIGNVIGGNTNGLNGACSGGPDGNAYSFNLATTANDAVVYGAVALKARTHTPGAGYTERVEFQHPHAVNPIGVAIEDKGVASPSNVTVNGSFSGLVDWAMVALEIKPPGGIAKSFAAAENQPAASLVPAGYQLEQNYPNPFSSEARSRLAGNPGTRIRYSLPQAGHARLTIYDLRGQTVSIPVDDFQGAGIYMLDWQAVDAHGRSLPSGVYFYRLEAGANVVTKRMTLLR